VLCARVESNTNSHSKRPGTTESRDNGDHRRSKSRGRLCEAEGRDGFTEAFPDTRFMIVMQEANSSHGSFSGTWHACSGCFITRRTKDWNTPISDTQNPSYHAFHIQHMMRPYRLHPIDHRPDHISAWITSEMKNGAPNLDRIDLKSYGSFEYDQSFLVVSCRQTESSIPRAQEASQAIFE